MDGKTFTRAVLVAAIAGNSVTEVAHDLDAIQPHVELEVQATNPPTVSAISMIGTKDSSEPGGHLRQRLVYARTHRANLSKKPMAMEDAYIDATHDLVRIRSLSPLLAQVHFNSLRHEIELTKVRTRGCRNFSRALPIIAKILGAKY